MAQLGTTPLGRFFLGMALSASSPIVIPIAPPDRTFNVPQSVQCWQGHKTPGEIINFSFNWTQELNGDTIASSTWLIESSDVGEVDDAVTDDGDITTILLSGGVSGKNYPITNTIRTEEGLTLEATFILFVHPYNL